MDFNENDLIRADSPGQDGIPNAENDPDASTGLDIPGWLDQLLAYSEEQSLPDAPSAGIGVPDTADAAEKSAALPEEVTGSDWQAQFGFTGEDAGEAAVLGELPEEVTGLEPAETEIADDLPDEAEDLQGSPAAESAAETAPANEEDDFYDRSKKEKKTRGGKHEKEFSIETDYRRDFGEYDRIHPIKVDRHHRTGCVGGLLYFLFILVTGALLGGVLWLAAMDVLAIGKKPKEVQIVVPDEFTVDEVTDSLYEGGLIKYKPLFKLFAKFARAEEKIDPGVYELKTSYDYRALVSCMQTSSGYRIETEVTVPEGYNLFQLFALLEEKEVCTQDELWETAANYEFEYDFLDSSTLGDRLRLEGYLFPDTYKFYVNDDPERVINKFLRNFNSKFSEEYRARAEELGYSVHDILSIASMIEKETGVNSERATIASVIYNRLNSEDYPYLQIDATVYYAADVMDAEFSLELDCPYNTYKYEGLPGPITNPGEASIRAALYPETTNYYYYAATKDFTTRFFTRYSDFESFVQSSEFQGAE